MKVFRKGNGNAGITGIDSPAPCFKNFVKRGRERRRPRIFAEPLPHDGGEEVSAERVEPTLNGANGAAPLERASKGETPRLGVVGGSILDVGDPLPVGTPPETARKPVRQGVSVPAPSAS